MLFISLASAEPRIWTNDQGQQVEGELVDIQQSRVSFKRTADGQVFEMSIERFSEADQLLIAKMRAEREAAPEKQFEGLEWPRRSDLPDNYDVEVILEDNEKNIYIYRTPNFEFQSDVKLARKVVRDFGKIFEGAYAAMQAFPLEWKPRPQDEHFKTRLFETQESYLEAGGIPNSGGTYSSRKREIWAPLTSLGVKKTSTSYTLDNAEDHSVLIHEITHQVHHDWLQLLPPWIAEGMAVYMESIPFDDGQFRFDKVDVADYLMRAYGQNQISMVPLEELMTIDHSTWLGKFEEDPEDLAKYYCSAYLLLNYFLFMDGEGDGKRIYAYCRAKEAGKPESQARDILLGGRSYAELTEALQRGYKREKVEIVSF